MNNRQRIDAEQTLYRTQQRVKKPDVYRNNIKKAKRIRHELLAQEEDEMKDDFVMQIASDSVNAASYLIGLNGTSVPVCFIHQIYSILPNPTLIDKELQEAIEKGEWRKFHVIGSVEDEYVIIKTEDYLKMMDEIKHEENNKAVFGNLVFISSSLFSDIQVDLFIRLIKDKRYYSQVTISTKDLNSFGINDADIKQLVMNGFLLPHLQVGLYWFSIRKQGHFMTNISNGRSEITRILKKRATKDIMESLLKSKRLHKTKLNMEFLLHDLVGSGRVERYSIGSTGNVIKLTNKGL
ncbi:hypothetical protein G6F37_002346 [Rhizopus arrhizus]|nr:hypothetical protein G6F38_012597 [Rhizopus arrhizus]KAG1162227.1 hypothetical protein G6F37_002346 [Rhizopus arrhizus]